ncbi:MAG: hypothetical protein Q9170_007044 [Blastenia crenularia]
MSLTEDAQSSTSLVESAPSQDEEHNDGQRGAPNNDEPIGYSSDDYVLDHLSDISSQIQSSVHTEYIGDYEELSSAADETSTSTKRSQPHKFHGPASTWRDRTASERQLAASLDQLRAKDLSVHLYNFYALKRQASEDGKGKEHEEDQRPNISTSGKSWASSKNWTAWPMAPKLVPRESNANSWETEADQKAFINPQMTSSRDILQDLLAARACKIAKERFYDRGSEPDPPSTNNNQKSKGQARILELTDEGISDDGDEPVVLADDQRAKDLLQPSLNHVLAKLDTVLIGLHHARSSYATDNNSSSRLSGMTDEEGSRNNKRRQTMTSRGRSRGSNRRRKAYPDSSENLSAVDDEPHPIRGRRSGRSGSDRGGVKPPLRSRSRLDRIGLRDWSDVLGVASMCGWDAQVVARAAERCSNLFEEGMVLRTLHEGQEGYHDATFLPNQPATMDMNMLGTVLQRKVHDRAFQPSVDQGSDVHEAWEDTQVGGVHIDGFLQPIPTHKSWGRKRKARRKK